MSLPHDPPETPAPIHDDNRPPSVRQSVHHGLDHPRTAPFDSGCDLAKLDFLVFLVQDQRNAHGRGMPRLGNGTSPGATGFAGGREETRGHPHDPHAIDSSKVLRNSCDNRVDGVSPSADNHFSSPLRAVTRRLYLLHPDLPTAIGHQAFSVSEQALYPSRAESPS